MSGALCAAAGLQPYVAPIPPLVANVNLNTSTTTFNVTGASGDLYTAFGVVISIFDTGGVPPYSIGAGDGVFNDGTVNGTGTALLVAASDGIHNPIGWSGMSVGAYVTCHVVNSIVDSDTPPSSASDRIPHSGGSFIIHRAS